MHLAIDTATRSGSVAAFSANGTVLELVELGAESGARLAPAVGHLLDRHGEVEGYAVDIGPGSFTGLRIGLAFLKGLSRALPGPVVALGSLEILAAALGEAEPEHPVRLAVLGASGPHVFAASFGPGPSLPVGLYRADDLAEALAQLPAGVAAGEGLGAVPGLARLGWRLCPEISVPSAPVLARLAAPILARGGGTSAKDLEPAYHQPSAAEARRLERAP